MQLQLDREDFISSKKWRKWVKSVRRCLPWTTGWRGSNWKATFLRSAGIHPLGFTCAAQSPGSFDRGTSAAGGQPICGSVYAAWRHAYR